MGGYVSIALFREPWASQSLRLSAKRRESSAVKATSWILFLHVVATRMSTCHTIRIALVYLIDVGEGVLGTVQSKAVMKFSELRGLP